MFMRTLYCVIVVYVFIALEFKIIPGVQYVGNSDYSWKPNEGKLLNLVNIR
jgi:hypothetical protein